MTEVSFVLREYDVGGNLVREHRRIFPVVARVAQVSLAGFEWHPNSVRLVVMPETGWDDGYQLLANTLVFIRTG